MRTRWLAAFGTATLLGACSLIVDLDTDALGGERSVSSGHSKGDDASVPDVDGTQPAVPCGADADCDDGNLCNGSERCEPNAANADERGCVPGEALACDDGIACTVDSCDPTQGCKHLADSTRCTDSIDCTVDICDPEVGCRHVPNQARCDFCQPGSECTVDRGCVGGFVNTCDDGDSCTVDQCDAQKLTCVHIGSCESGPDSCADAKRIVLTDGRGVAGGSFARVTPTYDTACSANGRDAVYSVLIESISDIIIDTTRSEARTAVAVATTCSEEGFQLACAGQIGAQDRGSRLVIHRYDPAREGAELFLLVDALDSTEEGEYVVTVDVLPVAEDTCSNSVLSLGVGGTLLGFMDAREPPNAWGTESGSCQRGRNPEAQPEAIVRVRGARDERVRLSAEGRGFAPTLYARSRCDDDDEDNELGCARAGAPGQTQVTLDIELDVDDEAFVFVDGGRDGAPYVLRSEP